MTSATCCLRRPASSANRRRWFALSVLVVGAFMDLLDATITGVAIPSIQKDLAVGYSAIQWISAGYSLAFALLLITGGRLGDILGRKRLFLIGMAGFTAASALCGLAQNPEMLIGARVLQGALAAIMVPQVLAIIHVTFPPGERGKVFGMYSAIAGLAIVFGPILGGLLVQWNLFSLTWRLIFLINLPVGLIGLTLGWRYIGESKSPYAQRLDLAGLALSALSLLMLVYPLMQGHDVDWPAWGFVSMGLSLPVLACFIAHQRCRTRKDGSPLVALSLFKAKSFASGLGVLLLFSLAIGILSLIQSLYLQLGLGWTPVHAGVTGIPFSIGLALASGVSVQVLVPKFGHNVLQAGVMLMIAGVGSYTWQIRHTGASITSWQMLPWLFVTGLGMGLIVAPIADIILSDVPLDDAGSASGLTSTTYQLGTAVGIALASVAFFGVMGGQAGHAVDTVTAVLRQQLVAQVSADQAETIIGGFRACAIARAAEAVPTHAPPSCRQAPGTPSKPAVEHAMALAGGQVTTLTFIRSFQHASYCVMGLLAAALALMPGLRAKRCRSHLQADSPPSRPTSATAPHHQGMSPRS
jgi:EmrB/QacA subfamily drug resistance transporter